MHNKFLNKHEISVCMGPGCKAWDAEIVLIKLKEEICKHNVVHILQSKCLNNCGGGVTLKLPKSNELIKLRNPDDLSQQILKIIMKRA